MKKQLFALFLLLALAGCATQEPTIGVLAPTTGDYANFGEEVVQAVLDAAGEDMHIIVEDTKCDAASALSAYRKLRDVDGADIIIGPACGSPQTVVAEAAKDEETLILLPLAAPRELYELSNHNVYNFQYALEDESTYTAEHLQERYSRVALVSYNNDFSEALRKPAARVLEDEYSIVLTELTPTDIQKIKQARPDALYAVDLQFFIEGGLQKLQEAGMNIPVYATYPASFPAVQPITQNVTYPYPTDLEGDDGLVYEIAHETGTYAKQLIRECADDTKCIHEQLRADASFAEGNRQRSFEMRTNE